MCPHAPCAGLCEEPQTDLISEAFSHKFKKKTVFDFEQSNFTQVQ